MTGFLAKHYIRNLDLKACILTCVCVFIKRTLISPKKNQIQQNKTTTK